MPGSTPGSNRWAPPRSSISPGRRLRSSSATPQSSSLDPSETVTRIRSDNPSPYLPGARTHDLAIPTPSPRSQSSSTDRGLFRLADARPRTAGGEGPHGLLQHAELLRPDPS